MGRVLLSMVLGFFAFDRIPWGRRASRGPGAKHDQGNLGRESRRHSVSRDLAVLRRAKGEPQTRPEMADHGRHGRAVAGGGPLGGARE